KGQIGELGQHIATYGFLGYPLLQLCDIAIFRGERVPVGKDQLAHLELGREVVRRFNYLYGEGKDVLVEPEATLSEFSEIPGIDGRKMSKSYNNAVLLADDEATTTKKVRSMVTDPLKVRRHDPGRPEICPVFALWKIVNPDHVSWVDQTCRSGELGCVQDKTDFAAALNEFLAPIRERRVQIASDPGYVERIIAEGSQKARAVAVQTLRDVKRAMKLL
ncbi:MAG: tryptophan--tRNA ligase, partial [Candidatus Eremiobacteraeota bacterium]|nr:tryptophan--tRNA ligase [Candidatus Eremiobacteraeota bacterium]